MKRREFMVKTLVGGAATVMGVGHVLAQTHKDKPAAATKPATVAGGIQRYRQLGRTGLWVSDIGMGAGKLRNPRVAIRAIELGISYFDTAPDYGDSEVNLGKALKTAKVDRDTVVIATKMCEHRPYPAHLGQNPNEQPSVEDIVRCCEGSLQRLQVEYVDVLMVHALGEPQDDRRLDNEALPRAIDKLKQQGKIRFAGASSHGPHNTTALLRQAIDSGFIDMFMLAYNYLSDLRGSTPSALRGLLDAANEKNIGIIAMKTVPAEKESQELIDLRAKLGASVPYPHLCFAWVLAQDPVAGLVKTMSSVRQVEEYVSASGIKLAAADLRALDAYAAALTTSQCRIGCGECLASCPADVPIADILRFNEYFANYGLERHAMRRFAQLNGHTRLAACASCDAPCQHRCPFGLPVKSLLARADANLHFDLGTSRA
jgi:predicted aldo/keto reductase-like oxidoreductase